MLSLLVFAALSAPILAAPAASSHNIYLVTCSTQSRRWRSGQTSVSAIAYFNTPLTATTPAADPKPDKAVTISPAQQWDSSKKTFTVWDNIAFTSSIDSGASTASKGTIVGSASLGNENFICFKDGETDIGIQVDAGSRDWDGWWDWDGNNGGNKDPNNGGWNKDPTNGGNKDPNNGGWNKDPNNGGNKDPNNGGWNKDPNNGRGRDNNDGRGRDNNDGRGRDNNDGRGKDNNDGRGRDNNDGRGKDHNDGRGKDHNDGRGRDHDGGRGGGRRPPQKRQRGGNGWRNRGRGYLDCVADFWCGSLGK